LGNVFAAARQRVLARHGLRLHSCWSYLLAVLPAPARAELERHSTDVLMRTQAVLWSLAATSYAVLLPGAPMKAGWVLASLIAAYLAYRQVCTVAANYCDAIEGIIVAHRKSLYEVAGFALPTSIADEHKKGMELSSYLDRLKLSPWTRISWPASSDR
jgi:hypothetical protein